MSDHISSVVKKIIEMLPRYPHDDLKRQLSLDICSRYEVSSDPEAIARFVAIMDTIPESDRLGLLMRGYESHRSLFQQAVMHSDVPLVRTMIETYHIELAVLSGHGRTIVHTAAQYSDLSTFTFIVQTMISKGLESLLFARTDYGHTPITWMIHFSFSCSNRERAPVLPKLKYFLQLYPIIGEDGVHRDYLNKPSLITQGRTLYDVENIVPIQDTRAFPQRIMYREMLLLMLGTGNSPLMWRQPSFHDSAKPIRDLRTDAIINRVRGMHAMLLGRSVDRLNTRSPLRFVPVDILRRVHGYLLFTVTNVPGLVQLEKE
jgi:hypothetical protein